MITDEKIMSLIRDIYGLCDVHNISPIGMTFLKDSEKEIIGTVREWLKENVIDDWKLELLTWIGKNATHPDETNVKRIAVSSLLTKIHKM